MIKMATIRITKWSNMKEITYRKKFNQNKFMQLLLQIDYMPNFKIGNSYNGDIIVDNYSNKIQIANKPISISICFIKSKQICKSPVMHIEIDKYKKFYKKTIYQSFFFPEETFDLFFNYYKEIFAKQGKLEDEPQDKLKIKIWLINYCNTIFQYVNKWNSIFYYTNKEKRKRTFLHKHKYKSK